MDYKGYRAMSTPASRHAVEKMKNLRKNIERGNSPVRGFFNKWFGDEKYLDKLYRELLDIVFTYIDQANIPTEVKNSIRVWEEFQSHQKGPTGPLDRRSFDKHILGDLDVEPFDLADTEKKILDEVFESLFEYLSRYVNLDLNRINFAEEWSKLPNTTVRGFPYNTKGAAADTEIIERGGDSWETALKFMQISDDFVCFPGFRIQGKEFPGPAKIRLVFIPPVHSQYMDNGIISESMRQLKNCPIFAGWQDPVTRFNTIKNAEEQCNLKGLHRIQLDYSKYDKHIHPYFQKKAAEYFEKVTSVGKEGIRLRNEQFNKFRKNQFIILPSTRNVPTFYNIPYQLPSGEKRTQHDGSIIGLVLMGYLWIKMFNQPIDWSLTNQLGDDAVFPIPKNYLAENGYTGTLGEISKHLERIGFLLNPTKAYPNEDMAFLQKLWVYNKGIYGIGTFTRSLASFIYKEKFSTPIKGIKHLWALELVSQISIMSEPFSKSLYNIHGVAAHLVQWWVDRDDKLNAVLNYLAERGALNPNSILRFIIQLTNLNVEQILDQLDALAYDHKGLSEALEAEDYGQVFPILIYMSEAKLRPVSREEMKELLDTPDEFISLSDFESSIGEDD